MTGFDDLKPENSIDSGYLLFMISLNFMVS